MISILANYGQAAPNLHREHGRGLGPQLTCAPAEEPRLPSDTLLSPGARGRPAPRGGCRARVSWVLSSGERGAGVDRAFAWWAAPGCRGGRQCPAVASWWRWSLVRLWLIRTNRHSVLTACLPR